MQMNKKNLKQGLKNQFISILHMIAFNIISFIVLNLANIGTKPTGKVYYGDLFSLREYKANYWCVIIFWTVFMILLSIFYTKYYKVDLKKQIHTHWCFVILFFIITIVFCFIELAILIITLVLATDIFSKTINYPDYIQIVALVYIIGYIAVDLIYEIRKSRHAKRLSIILIL